MKIQCINPGGQGFPLDIQKIGGQLLVSRRVKDLIDAQPKPHIWSEGRRFFCCRSLDANRGGIQAGASFHIGSGVDHDAAYLDWLLAFGRGKWAAKGWS